MYICKRICTNQRTNCLKELCEAKDFEMSIVELLDSNIVLVCIYRSPDGDIHLFLKKIGNSNSENAIKKKVMLCGD
jgi:hypothetical protein